MLTTLRIFIGRLTLRRKSPAIGWSADELRSFDQMVGGLKDVLAASQTVTKQAPSSETVAVWRPRSYIEKE